MDFLSLFCAKGGLSVGGIEVGAEPNVGECRTASCLVGEPDRAVSLVQVDRCVAVEPQKPRYNTGIHVTSVLI